MFFERLIRLAIAQRWAVLAAVLAMALVGVASLARLPIDAVPDITNVQVQINTAAPGHTPLESEQRITYAVESAMAGLPRLVQTRSLSRYGLSQVTVVFEDGTDLYFARQQVAERLAQARDQLPPGITPTLGPIATGLGEIFHWTVEAEPGARRPDGQRYGPSDLREIQDWIIKPQLRRVPGVTEINTIGGQERQYHVAPDMQALSAFGLTLADLAQAIERNNAGSGAGYIERQGEQYLVRAPGQIGDLEELARVPVKAMPGRVVLLRDVATVANGHALRTGAATDNGREVVLGTAFMLVGENSRTVAAALARQMEEVNRSLPPGVRAITVYDRTDLVDRAIATVRNNLLEGAALVVVVLFVFLGQLRAALITAMVIPLSMLFTFTGMASRGVSANLMSLGALDFGIIVDGAVVIVENCVRRLAHAQAAAGRPLNRAERFEAVFAAAREARRPLLYGQLIIMVVYLPVFALTGVEGRMFHPMAFTVVTALLGAMILSVTFVPAAVALFMHRPVQEHDNRLMRTARGLYRRGLERALAHGPVVLAGAAAALVLGAAIATRVGSEFVPTLDEGDLAIQVLRPTGTNLTQSVGQQIRLEAELKARHPEVERVFARTGTAEIAADPMPPNISDTYVMLKPRAQWPDPDRPQADLRDALQATAAQVPGQAYEFSQPIQLRFNELISGVRSDVALKIFGDDLTVLEAQGDRLAGLLRQVPGASEVRVEQTAGLPTLAVVVDREAAGRHGLAVGDVQAVVAAAVGGLEAGTLFEGDRRFGIVVRLADPLRADLATLAALPVMVPAAGASTDEGDAARIPLSQVARLDIAPGPNQISRENGKRRVVVTANVRGRDLGGFVAEARARVAQAAPVPPGYWVEWGGQFEHLASARQRLWVVVPAALALVAALLLMMLRDVRDSLLVFTGIPFALTGGITALWLRGIPMSISAAVGFIALCGVAVLNGLVMISFIRTLRGQGLVLEEAVREGALTRLRPVLMTALVAALGFVPMALATGTGAEVQRPLATVVVGGILSSTLLTLFVLPVLYQRVHRRRLLGQAPDGNAMQEEEVAR